MSQQADFIAAMKALGHDSDAILDVILKAAEIKQARDNAKEKLRAELDRDHVIEVLTIRDGFDCVYCNADLNECVVHVDHIVPLSRGGTNDIDNLALACDRCNCSKAARTPEEWRASCQ